MTSSICRCDAGHEDLKHRLASAAAVSAGAALRASKRAVRASMMTQVVTTGRVIPIGPKMKENRAGERRMRASAEPPRTARTATRAPSKKPAQRGEQRGRAQLSGEQRATEPQRCDAAPGVSAERAAASCAPSAKRIAGPPQGQRNRARPKRRPATAHAIADRQCADHGAAWLIRCASSSRRVCSQAQARRRASRASRKFRC